MNLSSSESDYDRRVDKDIVSRVAGLKRGKLPTLTLANQQVLDHQQGNDLVKDAFS